MSWAQAFLIQAISDLDAMKALARSKQPLCHQMHYLQMATEKLAKAYLCRQQRGNEPPKFTHAALSKFLRISKGFTSLRQALGYSEYAAFAAYIDSLIPLAEKVEALAPSSAGLSLPNPEYPWLVGNQPMAPVEYDFAGIVSDKEHLAQLYKLLYRLAQIMDQV